MLWDIALEFGENTVRLVTRERGIVLMTPSLGAMRGSRLIAIGEEALAMLGRTPGDVHVVRPFSGGSMSDARLTAQWLARLLEPFVSGAKVIKPSLVFTGIETAHPSEREMLVNTAQELGAGQCGVLDSSVAAAAGAGMDISRPEGFALADVGAGTMSVSLISYGRTAVTRRLPFGLNRIDRDIENLVRTGTGLSIGPRTAEELKLVLASALPAREITASAVGLDMKTGFPGERSIPASLVQAAVAPVIDALTMAARSVIAEAPDELSADLLHSGLVLTGGGALLSGLDKVLAERCALPCRIPESPMLCTAKGMAKILQDEQLSELSVRKAA